MFDGKLATILYALAWMIVPIVIHQVQRYKRRSMSVRVLGEVIGINEYLSHRTRGGHPLRPVGYSAAPVVRYVINGVEYVIESNTYERPPRHSVGEMVAVYYDPQDPNKAYISTADISRKMIKWGFVVGGMSLFVVVVTTVGDFLIDKHLGL